ncbi:hypothetical protein [Serratia odorifera]|uniref:hypothetical protein n=1 Tax=Serratia odorifera TaxID=618 RepID=UPI001F543ADB|nr:hypothetical protein [Serratia odorifera]
MFAFEGSSTWLGSTKAGVTAFSSWLDVVTLADSNSKSGLETDLLYQSLKLYFINGGGHCYAAPVDTLSALVPALDDVTLLVQAGVKLNKFMPQVTPLCKPGQALFALFDGPKRRNGYLYCGRGGAGYIPRAATGGGVLPWLTVPGIIRHRRQAGRWRGAYARVDRQRGVWKAPANVDIIGATPRYKVSDEVAGACNKPDSGHAINVIRAFRGTGPLIWGARTLQGRLTHGAMCRCAVCLTPLSGTFAWR